MINSRMGAKKSAIGRVKNRMVFVKMNTVRRRKGLR